MTRQKQLNSILIKPAGPDCNLACDYCFYLGKSRLYPDTRVHRMSFEVLEHTIRQMTALPSPHLSFGWQGGEPCLAGLSFFEKAVELQIKWGRGKTVGNSLQTNGLLIDGQWAKFLARYNFLTGLSLDGPRHIHDRHRNTSNGKGSWSRVRDAASLLLDSGVSVNALCVVNDFSARFPEEIYTFLKGAGFFCHQYIPCVEPMPAQCSRAEEFSVSPKAYGEFLISLFDLWVKDFKDGLPGVSVRFFDSLLSRLLGEAPSDCTLLETCGVYLTMEHNGDVFPCDFFVDMPQKLGNVTRDSLPELFSGKAMRNFGNKKAALAAECKNCDWADLCRGGCPKDRPLVGKNRSVSYFCESYRRFFEHAYPRLGFLAAQIETDAEIEAVPRPDRPATPPKAPRVGRNDPCPCGSGKKYKKCCLGVR